MENVINGMYITSVKEVINPNGSIQYQCMYDNYANGHKISTNIKNFINLNNTDSDIYLFNYFASILTSFKHNSKEMILSKINKVILVDIKKQYVDTVKKMFKDDKDVIKFSKPYSSTNGSSMTLMLLDLTKIYKKEKTIKK
jgi:hypothetical protein